MLFSFMCLKLSNIIGVKMKKWYKVLIVELLILMWILDFNNSIFISFLWIILHEFAHILVANNFGCRFNSFNISISGLKQN